MTLERLREFPFQRTDPSFWVYKRKYLGAGDQALHGGWVEITRPVRSVLNEAAVSSLENITETQDFSILSQNNEGSAMVLPADETVALEIAEQTLNRADVDKISKVSKLNNATFYVAIYEFEGSRVLAFRKVTSSWSTRKSNHITRAVFHDQVLTVDDRSAFEIDDFFDFFLYDDQLYILNKSKFESALNYRQAHESYFQSLVGDDDFVNKFSEVATIISYVGTNKIQLRRAVAIFDKGFYRDEEFLSNLRANYEEMHLDIQFDADGKIVPRPECCPDIFIALLDHRLLSRFSNRIYNAQDTSEVN